MKKLLVIAALAVAGVVSWAATSPFPPYLEERFNSIEAMTGDVTMTNYVSAIGATKVLETMLKAQSADGLHAKRIARATFNCLSGSGCPVGATNLGVALPAKAMIVRSFIHIETQLADTGTCTHAISCEDANNIKTATDLTGTAAEGFIEGASTGTAATMVSAIAAACNITFTVADGGSCVPTAGKGEVFVEYVVKN